MEAVPEAQAGQDAEKVAQAAAQDSFVSVNLLSRDSLTAGPPAEAAPPATSSANGAHACSYADVPTIQNLSESLLTAAVEAAILYTHGNPLQQPEAHVQPMFAGLEAFLRAPHGSTLPVRRSRVPASL